MKKSIALLGFLYLFSLAAVAQNQPIKPEVTVNSVAKLEISTERNLRIGFSPKGTYFFGLDDHGKLSVWDTATHALRYSLDKKLTAVNFSRDDRSIFIAAKKESQIIDAQTGNVNATLDKEINLSLKAEWSPDGQSVAAWIGRLTVGIFDTHSGKLKHSLVIRQWKRKKLAIQRFFDFAPLFVTTQFTPDSQRILTVVGDSEAK